MRHRTRDQQMSITEWSQLTAVAASSSVTLPLCLTDLNAAAAVGDVPAARYVAHQIKGPGLMSARSCILMHSNA